MKQFCFRIPQNVSQYFIIQILYAFCTLMDFVSQFAVIIHIHGLQQRKTALLRDICNQTFFKVLLIRLLQNRFIHSLHLPPSFKKQQSPFAASTAEYLQAHTCWTAYEALHNAVQDMTGCTRIPRAFDKPWTGTTPID